MINTRIDPRNLKKRIDDILDNPPSLISREEANDLEFLGSKFFKDREFAEALESNIMAARVFEELFKKKNSDNKLLFKAAMCWDFSGKFSFFVTYRIDDEYWKKEFYKLAIRFKETAGDFFVRNALFEEKKLREKGFSLAGNCYNRAGSVAALFLGEYRKSAIMRRKSAYFYEKSGKSYEAQWKLARAVDNLCHFEKVPYRTLERLFLRIKKIARKNEAKGGKPYPDNFDLKGLMRTVKSVLG